MKKQNNNYNWEPAYSIKKKGNYKYTVNRKVDSDSNVKIFTAVFIILFALVALTALYCAFKNQELMEDILKVSDSYIFLGITTFIIFLVFKRNKKEYNKSKKGVK